MSATTQTYAAAMVDALHDALGADRRVSLIGSHVLGLGPQRYLMDRIRRDFPDRIVDPPTAEAGIAAAGAGAAMAGARPFVDLGTAAFSFLAWTQLVNEAAVAYGLTLSALASPNPTIILSHAKLLGIEGPMPRERKAIPFGKADIKRKGRDVTIVATSLMVHYALEAAATLAAEGIEAEIVDLRTLVPLDEATILLSVERTGRLVVVDECPLRCGIAS